MRTIFTDDFKPYDTQKYPYNWALERNSENPNDLGWVDDGEFNILYEGNKHLPIIPPTKDFELELTCRGDSFFSPNGLQIFFRYDRIRQEGYCLNYLWGVTGTKTHMEQVEVPRYKVSLNRYYGLRKQNKFELIAENEVAGFCDDLASPQRLGLNVTGGQVLFYHNDNLIGSFTEIAESFDRAGAIAFDRTGDFRASFALTQLKLSSDERIVESVVLPEKSIEFPASVNGMISSYIFHYSILEAAGRKVLRLRLSGGPSKKVWRTNDRNRFNEKMRDPYVRLESRDGRQIGKFLMLKGTVGLNDFHWNPRASIMLPADGQCPIEHDFVLEELPNDPRVFIGYENYVSDDSISLSGGPSEAVIDDKGDVLFAGSPLSPGTVMLDVESSPEKSIVAQIPQEISFYEDAVAFARNNHFFVADEKVEFQAVVRHRDETVGDDEFRVVLSLENTFKEKLNWKAEFPLAFVNDPLSAIPNVKVLKSCPFEIPELSVGVYHLLLELYQGDLKHSKLRRAFEVMPDNPKSSDAAPLVSGLPKLFVNILSGTRSEHFFPWSHATTDISHYNCGGNNFFELERKYQGWNLFSLYGREWPCWCHFWGGDPEEIGVAANADLIEHADYAMPSIKRRDLWAPKKYQNQFIFDQLLDFLKGEGFSKATGTCLDYDTLAAKQEPGLTLDEFQELVDHYWTEWILHFTEVVSGKVLPELSADVRSVNPDCKPYHFCPVYPTYGSVYKSGYFPYYFGVDLRRDLAEIFPGPNGFEDYPYSSGYAIARGIYQLASCKLEAPDLKLYPEVFAINGETNDSHVVFANPPYGRSDPPKGYFIKQLYEYCFGVSWFDEKGFNFWNDHGYYPKTWDMENYDEMLYVYSFVNKVKPVKPMRTTAFVFSLAACMAHPDYFEYDEELFQEGYVMNTAEEAVAFAYEQARWDGQQAGFVVKMEDLCNLSAPDVDTLVLPPLCGLEESEISSIRKLHEEGVNLIGFENASGLEDLFGVRKLDSEIQINEISVCPDTILSELEALVENTEHPLCRSGYSAANAEVLLKGNDDSHVLVMNKTKWGKTAFYTIPPTFVRRSQTRIATYGQESISDLINQATAIVSRHLGNPVTETTAGKTIAFWDDKGDAHIIVEEDVWPRSGGPISPLVTIKIANVKTENISCDKEFSVVEVTQEHVKLRLRLDEHESARIKIKL